MKHNIQVICLIVFLTAVFAVPLLADTLATEALWRNTVIYCLKTEVEVGGEGDFSKLAKPEYPGMFLPLVTQSRIDVKYKGLAIVSLSKDNLMGIEGRSSLNTSFRNDTLFLEYQSGSIAIQQLKENKQQPTVLLIGADRVLLGKVEFLISQLDSFSTFLAVFSDEPVKIISKGEQVLINKGMMYNLDKGIMEATPKEITSRYASWKKDLQYIRNLLGATYIYTEDINLRIPSMVKKEKWFRSRFKGTGGRASYEDVTYNLFGFVYVINIRKFALIYDIFFAFDDQGHFRNQDWDEWSDLVNKINYLRYGDRNEVLYLLGGNIESSSLGYGLLTSRYTNSINYPFEKKAGLDFQLRFREIETHLIVNRIWDPTVIGGRLAWNVEDNMRLGLSYMGDMDQFADVPDSDGDDYPDKVDPQPNTKNTAADSIILANEPFSLREVDNRSVHGISLDFMKVLTNMKYFKTDISGEFCALFKGGQGLSFPNLYFNFVYFRFGVGLEFQTRHFQSALFNRYYERDKTVWVLEEERLILRSKEAQLQDIGNYLYGWNNRLLFFIPNWFTITSKFRDVTRGEEIDRSFFADIKFRLKQVPYVENFYFYIQQDHVEKLFGLMSNGSGFGIKISIIPHKSVKLGVRYNQRYEDDNGDGDIQSPREVRREFLMQASIDFNYYYELWRDYRKAKREAKQNDAGEID
ncbi:hypothetical protein JW877_02670 [bacterium]|nr:hypothetical protein [bacterium]